jgi:hypothetical protein
VGASRVEAIEKARSSAKTLRSAMNWLEDSEYFEEAHRALDDAGRFIRQNFRCTIALSNGAYRQNCPVALAHNRVGLSVEAIIKKSSCSICWLDPQDCAHITGRIYDGEPCIRVIEETEPLPTVALVYRPSVPDARFLSLSFTKSELRKLFGSKFRPGMPLFCDRCLSECEGVNDPREASPLGGSH